MNVAEMVEAPAGEDLLHRIARFGLRGVEAFDGPVVLERDAWPLLAGRVASERLVGLAAAACAAGLLVLDPEDAAALRERHREAMTLALLVERMLIEVRALLRDAGIEPVVLKGPALAHTVYGDPALRPFVDLDLLVPTADWADAGRVLRAHGFDRALPEPRPRFDERFGKAAELTRAGSPQLDLHRTLVIGPFGLWIDADEAYGAQATFRLGGETFGRLDDAGLLVNACVHASLGWQFPLAGTVRDVGQIALGGNVDWDVFADRITRWRLVAVVRDAFVTASETLGVALPAEAAACAQLPARRSERRALAAYTTAKRGRGGLATSTFRAIPGIAGKLAYGRALLMPSRSFMAARTGSGGMRSYARRWSVPAGWTRRS